MLGHIGTRLGASDVLIAESRFRDKRIDELLGILDSMVAITVKVVRGICRNRRRQMVLKEEVVLVRRATESAEYVAPHKMVNIGSKSVNNLHFVLATRVFGIFRLLFNLLLSFPFLTHIMIVPDIDLRNLPICQRKRIRIVPSNVILQVVVIAL